ncbi:3-phosphoserine/phosphohydroxythreonine transaminase [Lishizhenia sp.]|uniref:3-phosphoserine/phosphohydroxythreonine transaminase n=1 Tax=Lishizhenia sp. TaxID=2497594 RepID=UPI00299D8E18|nr:3-phosphoserine/phosphohydroxythreonine transaminase [Lishizhenia sp.]MDX1445136.1 3-phosphoserine/phosphohydroxythreonine transaminase [Lishizhenia sp.]
MKHNFGAGPCILPQEVFKKAAAAVIDFNGLSILEVSHRSADFVAVMEEARENVKKALNVPAGYTVLFLQGGASLGFLITAYNMMGKHKRAGYINTGTWSSKAIKEAKGIGLDVVEVASSKDKGFSYIPKGFDIPEDIDFLHFTSNNTIAGTQFKDFPKTNVPLVCDMSSDIFSKEINVADFDIIYAGAQKNLGPAGATLYIVKDEILGKSTAAHIPSYLDLAVHADKDSMFNTPPVYSVFVANLNLQHMLANGGVQAIAKENQAKAELIYKTIDENPLFEGTTAVEDRSEMNVTFRLKDESLTDKFNAAWNAADLVGLKGHRSVGGFRASMYNALPLSSVQVLADLMNNFAKENA